MKLSDLQPGSYTISQEDKSPGFLMSTVNALSNLGIGSAYRGIKDITNLGELPLKGINYLAQKSGSKTLQKAFPTPSGKSIVDIPEIQQRAETGWGKTGQFATTLAEFLAPSGAIIKGQKALAATKLIQKSGYIGKLASRMIPEAIADFGVEYGRTGNIEKGISSAKWGAGTVGILNILGDTLKATYWPEVKESVTRALGLSGKTSAGKVVPQIENKISGLSVMKQMAPETKITGIDGIQKAFNPSKASYFDSVQALASNKNTIYSKYSQLAKEAGEKATVNLTDIVDDLDAVLLQARTSDYKNAAQKILGDLYDNFGTRLPDGSTTLKDADIMRLQTFLQDLNNSAASTLAGKSDKAYGQIAVDTAGKIREILDITISSKTGGQYQGLRSQYASLKSIEDDLVRRFKQEASKLGGGLTDYIYLMNTPELITSVLTLNPTSLVSSIGTSALAAIRKKLISPDRYLRRAFDLIDSKGASNLSLRLFGGVNNTPLTEMEKNLMNSVKSAKFCFKYCFKTFTRSNGCYF